MSWRHHVQLPRGGALASGHGPLPHWLVRHGMTEWLGANQTEKITSVINYWDTNIYKGDEEHLGPTEIPTCSFIMFWHSLALFKMF